MIEKINAIIQAAKKYNLPPSIVLAQAILESGWFKKAPYNNFFGIKATKKDIEQGRYFISPTYEYVDGKKIKVNAKFRKFSSIDDAISFYNDMIKRNFPNADKNRNNPVLFLNGLFEGKYKYATDPRYKSKILKIIDDLKKKNIFSKKTIGIVSIVGLTILTFFMIKKFGNRELN
jgi:flagellum-specific peptidoglycan hydrolase FlgJ